MDVGPWRRVRRSEGARGDSLWMQVEDQPEGRDDVVPLVGEDRSRWMPVEGILRLGSFIWDPSFAMLCSHAVVCRTSRHGHRRWPVMGTCARRSERRNVHSGVVGMAASGQQHHWVPVCMCEQPAVRGARRGKHVSIVGRKRRHEGGACARACPACHTRCER